MAPWHPRADILELSHRWPVVFLLFLVGSLVGWRIGLILPSPYRAEASFYVGFNADPITRNPDDYKNWYLSQLEVLALSDDLLQETLARLQGQDEYWSSLNIEALKPRLGTYWRNAGIWRLRAEWADGDHALQLAQAWGAAFLEWAIQSISDAGILIELGGGFHPELTGRENIYLNMALLGHSRRTTDELFDSIIDFAEIGDFIEAPIRTYSTGMVARLGFAVATCIRPEVLLVDEVLSVGDVRFQEKCLNRMYAFQALGTTIVIVSHSMMTVETFCTRTMWLDHGSVLAIGPTHEVVDRYIEKMKPESDKVLLTKPFITKPVPGKASIQELAYASLNDVGHIYSAQDLLALQHGTVSFWLKFHGEIPDWGAAIFHTDDSRFVIYAGNYAMPDSERELRVIVGRAGGNRRVMDTYYGTSSFPEVAAISGLNEWHLITLSWYGYPNGVLRMYLDGNLAMQRTYDPRYDDGRPLPTSIAIRFRPREWMGELIEQSDGNMLDARPETSMSILNSGAEFRDLRLYPECLTQEQVMALAFAEKPGEINR